MDIYGVKKYILELKQVFLDMTKVCPIVIVEWSIPKNSIGKTQAD